MKKGKIAFKVLILSLLCPVTVLFSMERVKKIVRQVQGKLEYTEDILQAAKEGRLESVKYWVGQGADKESQNIDKQTPLEIAAKGGYLEIVRYLVEQKANKERPIEEYWPADNTALIWAARAGHLDIVKYLIDQGANKNARGQSGTTALIAAVEQGHADIVKYLMEQRVDTEIKGYGDMTALSKAVSTQQPNLEIVRYLVEGGADKETKGILGHTPLVGVALAGPPEVLKYLVEQGADTSAKDVYGSPVFIEVARRYPIELVRFLLQHGANIEVTDKFGYTALMRVVNAEELDKVKLLIQYGAKFDNIIGKLLDVIAKYNDNELYELLVDKGLNIYQLNAQGESLLVEPLIKKNDKRVGLLITKGVNPYQRDKAGLNAFDYAHGNPEVIALLNQTRHKAPTDKAPASQEISVDQEGDIKKAIRRLRHIKKAMQPELSNMSEENMKDSAAQAPAVAGLTQTEAHWKQFRAKIERLYGNVLDDPLVKRVLVREKEAVARDKYVFYRSEPGKYRVYEYFIEELYSLVNLYSKTSAFVWNRFFKDAAKEQTINQYIDTRQSQAHKVAPELNVLLSANIALFGNVDNDGSSTWYYFLNNYEATGEINLSDMFKRVFDRYGFDEKYIGQLLALHQGILEKSATLQQIIIPKNIVDEVAMFATDGYCFPWQRSVDRDQVDSCWDDNALSVDRNSNPRKGRYTCIASIIDKYRDGRIEINDNMQARILMNAVYGLNPDSGIEIYQYTRIPEKKLQHFKDQVKKIIDEMFAEWLKERLQKKQAPQGAEDEPLGDLFKHLGKGRRSKL